MAAWLPGLHITYVLQWRPVWRALPEMLWGAAVTAEVTALSMIMGLALGLVLATARLRGRGPALAFALATTWVELARNTPSLFQIYMAFFGLGAFGVNLSSFTAVLLAITFNNAGYLAEILRGGFASVPRAQRLAGRSLGMSALQTGWYVMVPQVLRSVFHPITNQMLSAMLTTSLGMVVGLRELAGVTQSAQSQSFRTFEFFVVAAAIYYLLAKVLLLGARVMGRRLLKVA